MEKTISFWQHPDGNKVRILYLSPVSWDNTLMADIDLNDESITQVVGYEENLTRLPNSTLKYIAMQIYIESSGIQGMTLPYFMKHGTS